jgi:hypothetical protein
MDELLQAQQEQPPNLSEKGYFTDAKGRIGYLQGFWVPPTMRRRVLDSVHLSTPYLHPGAARMRTEEERLHEGSAQPTTPILEIEEEEEFDIFLPTKDD